jgi:UDP-glucose 4-epimerase
MSVIPVAEEMPAVATSSAGGTLAGRRILVTGATGFLGAKLCQELHGLGAEVHGVSRRPPVEVADGPRWLQGDASDMASVEAAFAAARPEVVFHLASPGVGSPEFDHVLPTLHGDLVATVNALTAATRRGCDRLVLAASLEEPLGVPAVPMSPYAAAKWAAAGYARMFHALYRTPVVMVRPYMTFGPGQRPHKIVPYVINALLRGEAPTLGSGRRLVDWVYLDDVVRGLLLAAERPGIEGAELDLGSGTLVAVRDVVERIARIIGAAAPRFGAQPDRPAEVERRANTSAVLAALGWRAEIPLDDGLRRTVEWHRRAGQWGEAGCAS